VLALGPGFAWRAVSAAIAVALVVSILILPRVLRRSGSASLAVVPRPGNEREAESQIR
jgi:hypothetical protein